jgi:hypothetical protein
MYVCNIYIYTHTYIHIYSIHLCARVARILDTYVCIFNRYVVIYTLYIYVYNITYT